MREVRNQRLVDEKIFSIAWSLGSFCNYDCSYCWPTAKSKEYKFFDIQIMKDFVDYLKKHCAANEFETFRVCISGGEPTTYKHLFELINYIKIPFGNLKYEIEIGTNLSASTKYFDKLIECFEGFSKHGIDSSYHEEHALLDKFVEKCVYLRDKTELVVRSVLTLDNCESFVKSFYKFYENKIFFVTKIDYKIYQKGDVSFDLWPEQYRKDLEYIILHSNKKHVKIINEDGSVVDMHPGASMIVNQQINFNGWMCNAGRQNIVVDTLGNIKRCHSDKNNSLGNILSPRLLNDYTPCSFNYCTRAFDISIPKYKEQL